MAAIRHLGPRVNESYRTDRCHNGKTHFLCGGNAALQHKNRHTVRSRARVAELHAGGWSQRIEQHVNLTSPADATAVKKQRPRTQAITRRDGLSTPKQNKKTIM
eukprot:scaffold63946_cov31-Tisochrysis_lutea.AAC.2